MGVIFKCDVIKSNLTPVEVEKLCKDCTKIMYHDSDIVDWAQHKDHELAIAPTWGSNYSIIPRDEDYYMEEFDDELHEELVNLITKIIKPGSICVIQYDNGFTCELFGDAITSEGTYPLCSKIMVLMSGGFFNGEWIELDKAREALNEKSKRSTTE